VKRKRRHIHSKLLVLTSMNGVFFLSKWFVLLYRLTKSFPFSMNYLDFIKGELSYFLFVNLDGGWCLGVGMCFFCKWKTCNVAKLINIICMRKKKGTLNMGLPFKEWQWSSPGVLLYWQGNSYSSQSICNNLDSCKIYVTIICHPKVLEFRMLHVRFSLM